MCNAGAMPAPDDAILVLGGAGVGRDMSMCDTALPYRSPLAARRLPQLSAITLANVTLHVILMDYEYLPSTTELWYLGTP